MKKLVLLLLIAMGTIQLFASPKLILETVEAASRISGKTLSKTAKAALQKTLTRAFLKHGDEALRTARTGGLEAIKQGAKYGDDFWRLTKNSSPQAIRSLALHADELMPIAKRLGPDFMRLEGKVPGLGAKVVAEFGDDAALRLARTAPPEDIAKLLGYAGKADTPATKKLLLEKYHTGGSQFLNNLNWKHIMATGLSAAAITTAYQLTDGVQEGLKEVAKNRPETFAAIINSWTAPVRWAVFIALLVLLTYPAYRCSRRLAEKIKKHTQTETNSKEH